MTQAVRPAQPGGPVGVFDSGVGGLSILRAIRRELPAEQLLYVADSGHAPYGPKHASRIEERTLAIAGFLVARGAKAIVVACNTATSVAVEALRARYAFPIVGIEPAVKPAAQLTRTGVIGVLATDATVASARFASLLDRYGHAVRVAVQACPGLADCVEAGDLQGTATRALLERYVTPLRAAGADVIVLGCTHYAFLLPLLREVAGSGVEILAPDAAVARHLGRRLAEAELLRPGEGGGGVECRTTGDPVEVARVARILAADEPWLAAAEWEPLPD
jgi:glutamate racemase